MEDFPSQFAINQLKKFGWSEGSGLGKNQDGICKPIKASMKFSRIGLGAAYQPTDVNESVWSNVYEDALSRVCGYTNSKSSLRSNHLPNANFFSSGECHSKGCISLCGKKVGLINFQLWGVLKGSEEFALPPKRNRRVYQRYRIKAEGGKTYDSGNKAAIGSVEQVRMTTTEECTGISRLTDTRTGLFSRTVRSISQSSLFKLSNRRPSRPATRFNIRYGKLARAVEFL